MISYNSYRPTPDTWGIVYVLLLENGKTVSFNPYVYEWWWNDNSSVTEASINIEIQQAGNGTISNNIDTTCTFSYIDDNNNINLDMGIITYSTQISMNVKSQDEKSCHLYVYGKNGRSESEEIYLHDGNEGSMSFFGLEMNTEYHFGYILCDENYNAIAWWDGTEFPFSITTGQTDKTGGIIHGITVDKNTFTVKYELFPADGSTGYIRYKKEGDGEDWIYEKIWADSDYTIIRANSGTTYNVELIGADKKTIYDKRDVTTEGMALDIQVDGLSATGSSIGIEISNYEGSENLVVEADYIDCFGISKHSSGSISASNFQNGKWTYMLRNLEANSDYEVEVRVYRYNSYYSDNLICKKKVSFKTKESSVKKENITATITAGSNSANVNVKINDITLENDIKYSYQYRMKGAEDSDWLGSDSRTILKDTSEDTFSIQPLSINAEYEIMYNIDGTIGTESFKTSTEGTDAVIPEIKVTQAYIKGLEVECKLNGTVDSSDEYKWEVSVYSNRNGNWSSSGRRAFDAEKEWTAKEIVSPYYISPGQTQKWKYQVYKNDSLYYSEYFD